MAKIEELVGEVADPRLRTELALEVKRLKTQKKFGLVFEEHLPETVRLPNFPIRVGDLVAERGVPGNNLWFVRRVKGVRAECRRLESSNSPEDREFPLKDLISVKRFGEAIYPALVPVDRIGRADSKKPWHTLINADNFHALQLLLYAYEGKIDVIYIDPPYNTGARDWKYNNDYVDKTDAWRHSKWLSMMKKRLSLAKRLLRADGVMIVTIDDYELCHLGTLLEEIFPAHEQFIITIEHNKRGRRGKNFAKSNEWAIYLVPEGVEVIQEERTADTIGGETRNLRRTGSGSKRTARPRKFYPIWVNEETLEVVSAGDPIPKDAPWKVERKGKLVTVWPIDEDGKEKNWHYGVERTRKNIAENKLEARPRDYGIQVYYTLREKDSKKWKTVWSKPSLDASTHGSELLSDLLGGQGDFEFPKSVYAVADCLTAACGHKKNALILDFFSGSGTTLHATCMLNADDQGRRRCILVTNNEVSEARTKELNRAGHFQGDRRFEKHGIAESVTWPRCKAMIKGRRQDGTELSGKYLNGSDKKAGFKENLEFYRIDFLDPGAVAIGEQFEAVLPILWMVAGCNGEREPAKGSTSWFIPSNSPFAVLIKERDFGAFRQKIAKRTDLTYVFLVTDSDENFRAMSRGLWQGIQPIQLYKSYLENFTINTKLLAEA